MSNLQQADFNSLTEVPQPPGLHAMLPREVPLGGLRAMNVWRTLPQRGKSLVGAWCFIDHYGPDDVSESGGMVVARHPHTGLATVSWLFDGTINHLDSAGNQAVVRPGELNVMIAGSGITHQEFSTPETQMLHGVQLWYALPDQTRHTQQKFIHYEPPFVKHGALTARVFIGELLGSSSPVQTETTELVGAELILDANSSVEIAVRSDFEYAVLAENAPVTVNSLHTNHRELAYVPTGTNMIRLESGDSTTRIMLLGGVPFGEEIVMWWNFIGRTHEEIVEYRRRYQAELGFEPADAQDAGKPDLFGPYPTDQPAPIPAPVMPITRLKSRK